MISSERKPTDSTQRRLLEELWGRDPRYYELARQHVLKASRESKEYAFVRRHLPVQGLVLEVGCGDGSNVEVLDRAGLRFVGCDLSPLGLSCATQRMEEAEAAVFVVGDAARLPFRPESFDAVIAISLLEHLTEPEAALGQMTHVLKPGGALLLVSPQYGGALGSSPCRRGGGTRRFLLRMMKAHRPGRGRSGGDRLNWETVRPAVLDGVSYEGDRDVVVEPELTSLIRFLEGRGLRVHQATSGLEWHSWLESPAPAAVRAVRWLVERLGRWGIPPYRSMGPLVALCASKEA